MENTWVPRVAIIEDNDDLREEVLFYLQHRGFFVWGANSAETFWKQLHFHPVDIVLVDLGLPEEDGFSVVEHLRKLGRLGIVIITARGSKQERLRGLDLGADLFLVKPINFAELVDTLMQLGQRLEIAVTDSPTPVRQSDRAGEWHLDVATARLITPGKAAIHLTPKELELLRVLIESANQIFDRWRLHDMLFQHTQNPDVHRVDVVISRLRKKVREQGETLPLRSIFGKGVVFVRG